MSTGPTKTTIFPDSGSSGGGGGVLNNLTATTDPIGTSDSAAGYSAGSLWLRPQGSPPSAGFGVWICKSAGVGVADWRRIQAKNSLAETVAPTSNEDANDGFAVGSLYGGPRIGWYVCTNADVVGYAAWARISPRHNIFAIVAPTVSDDSSIGYAVGSYWADFTTPRGAWVCVDPSVGAAFWLPHAIAKDNIQSVGATSSGGTDSMGFARIDHVHRHGDQAASSTMHAIAIAAGTSGFMSGADKTKLDGIATAAAALTSTAPVAVGTSAVGVGTTAARHDHVHGQATRDRTVAINSTIVATTDEVIRVSAQADLTLPNPNTLRSFLIKKTGTGTYTINLVRFGSEQIEGTAATLALPGAAATDRPAWTVWSDGTNWWIA